ncbi:putative transmembrane protein [Cupriavidus necator H850]|uniref:DUF1275 family protein n=1 Tax=Cupriavidus necator TaxID=106590 RepID=UPI0002EA8174|nr:YoaK family protein [Cupriavidus necator]KAI3606573.1 putative transmembrane protein [Cupriavidus necator H850]MDX6013616.1 YoaK family protein [Cupriavidus necator]
MQQYTSHMSGVVSAMADNLALGSFALVLDGVGALLSFLGGAACSAVLVNWGRRERLHSEYALPLALEAGLLLCFGLIGGNLGAAPVAVHASQGDAAVLLCCCAAVLLCCCASSWGCRMP